MRFSELFKEGAWRRRESAVLLIAVAIIPGLFHVYWPLLLVVFIALIIFMPVPRVLDSIIGRIFIALLMFYAVQQLAALVQLFLLPNTGFVTTDILTGIFAGGLVLLYGRSRIKPLKLVRATDLFIIVACLFFVVCFIPVAFNAGGASQAVAVAGEQVVDSANHWEILSNLTINQNLSRIYGSHDMLYYPSGFHFTTAFIEDAFSLAGGDQSWLTNAIIYFGQYILFGCVLMVAIVYLGYALLERIYTKAKPKLWMYGAVAVATGICSIILFLLMFVSEGFLNFYYVCATIIAAMCYLIEDNRLWLDILDSKATWEIKTFPVSVYLLLGLGVSMSWPLLTPAILFTALLLFEFLPLRRSTEYWRLGIRYMLPLAAVLAAHLAAMYVQIKFLPSSFSHVNIPGALQNFNVVFILIGLGLISWVIFTNQSKSSRLFMSLFAPFILLLVILMLLQYFELGQASYYLIKAAIPFEIFTVALLSVEAVVWAERGTDLPVIPRFCWPILVVLSICVATIGTVPQPLLEVRSLYRNMSGLGKPPYIDSDAAIIARLGEQNKIDDFNLTILHYNPANHYYYAQIETGIWANAMSTHEAAALAGDTDADGKACFTRQYNLLAAGVSTTSEQRQLVGAVKDCAQSVRLKGENYYIVSDLGSVAAIRKQFGPNVLVVTE